MQMSVVVMIILHFSAMRTKSNVFRHCNHHQQQPAPVLMLWKCVTIDRETIKPRYTSCLSTNKIKHPHHHRHNYNHKQCYCLSIHGVWSHYKSHWVWMIHKIICGLFTNKKVSSFIWYSKRKLSHGEEEATRTRHCW